jgi:hypothetical protein
MYNIIVINIYYYNNKYLLTILRVVGGCLYFNCHLPSVPHLPLLTLLYPRKTDALNKLNVGITLNKMCRHRARIIRMKRFLTESLRRFPFISQKIVVPLQYEK